MIINLHNVNVLSLNTICHLNDRTFYMYLRIITNQHFPQYINKYEIKGQNECSTEKYTCTVYMC